MKKPNSSVGAITIQRQPDDTEARALARGVLRPTVGAAIAMQTVYGKSVGDKLLDVGELVGELATQCGKVNDGDLRRMESMLVSQVHTLDALFNRLTQRAMAQEYLKQFETHMRLALKAQGQARATVEALAAIKNPKSVAFVQQANVSTNVQVNNGAAMAPPTMSADARAHGNDASAPSRLLEANNGERLDTRAQGEASPWRSSAGSRGNRSHFSPESLRLRRALKVTPALVRRTPIAVIPV